MDDIKREMVNAQYDQNPLLRRREEYEPAPALASPGERPDEPTPEEVATIRAESDEFASSERSEKKPNARAAALTMIALCDTVIALRSALQEARDEIERLRCQLKDAGCEIL